jgi:hypothetical protein
MRRLQNGDSLEDKSRRPDYSPTKVSEEIEEKAGRTEKKDPVWAPSSQRLAPANRRDRDQSMDYTQYPQSQQFS